MVALSFAEPAHLSGVIPDGVFRISNSAKESCCLFCTYGPLFLKHTLSPPPSKSWTEREIKQHSRCWWMAGIFLWFLPFSLLRSFLAAWRVCCHALFFESGCHGGWTGLVEGFTHIEQTESGSENVQMSPTGVFLVRCRRVRRQPLCIT